MDQVHVFISGKVQGVFFRDFVKKSADELNISGWVRNVSDGRVEAVFLGKRDDIHRLIEDCSVGPQHADVHDVEVFYESLEQFESFEVIQ